MYQGEERRREFRCVCGSSIFYRCGDTIFCAAGSNCDRTWEARRAEDKKIPLYSKLKETWNGK
jgi:hypothetical protein